jgi:hypothetical protein
MLSPFIITPYVSAGPVTLGMTRTQLHALLGPPDSSRKSRFGPKVTDRWLAEDLTIMLSHDAGSVVEIGFGSEQSEAEVAGVRLFDRVGPDVYRDLCRADGAPREDVGFTVLFKFGITLDGFLVAEQDDRAVTVFAKGIWDENDARLKPAKL